MTRTALLVVALVAIPLAVALWALANGASRWERATTDGWETLQASGTGAPMSAASGGTADVPSGVELPPPVARYFDRVLQVRGRRVARAILRHEGEFALKPNEWKPFTSRQLYVTAPRGFLWDATIRMLPLVHIRVRDSFIRGRGATTAALGGAISIVDVGGSGDMAAASLLRYLAEAAWLPTALLPGDGVAWSAIDDSTARVTLVDGALRLALDVHFGTTGGIERVTGLRGREVKGRVIPTPWEGRFSEELLTVEGMRIPASGEVAWLLPEGRFAYWRGRVVEARFDFR